jgi:hypothetical protein
MKKDTLAQGRMGSQTKGKGLVNEVMGLQEKVKGKTTPKKATDTKNFKNTLKQGTKYATGIDKSKIKGAKDGVETNWNEGNQKIGTKIDYYKDYRYYKKSGESEYMDDRIGKKGAPIYKVPETQKKTAVKKYSKKIY